MWTQLYSWHITESVLRRRAVFIDPFRWILDRSLDLKGTFTVFQLLKPVKTNVGSIFLFLFFVLLGSQESDTFDFDWLLFSVFSNTDHLKS